MFKKSNCTIIPSIHVLDNSTLYPELENAYQKADKIIFECDLEQKLSKSNKRLQHRLSPKLFEDLKITATSLGLSINELNKMYPFTATSEILLKNLQPYNITVADGVDVQLWKRAKKDSKISDWLENSSRVFPCIIQNDIKEQISILEENILHPQDVVNEVKEMIKNWRNHDDVTFEKMLDEYYEHYPNHYKKLIKDRNHAWMPSIERLIQGNVPTLIVVGKLHCVGEEGLPKLLEKAGHKLQRIL